MSERRLIERTLHLDESKEESIRAVKEVFSDGTFEVYYIDNDVIIDYNTFGKFPLNKEKTTVSNFDGFIFLDLETTGLDEADGVILELGVAIYSSDLELQDVYQSLVYGPEQHSFFTDSRKWHSGEYAYGMHEKNGLNDELRALGGPQEDLKSHAVATQVYEFLQDNGAELGKEPICGSSIGFDRRWLNHHMPSVDQFFHYRIVDVSSTREQLKRINPSVYEKLEEMTKPETDHRVVGDIMDSVKLLRNMRDLGVFGAIA